MSESDFQLFKNLVPAEVLVSQDVGGKWSPVSTLGEIETILPISDRPLYVYGGIRDEVQTIISNGLMGGASDITTTIGIWADFDFKITGTLDWENLYERAQASTLGPPSLVINSGGGLHLWWISSNPIPVSEYIRHTAILKTIFPEADQAVYRPQQAMRLPGSLNFKKEYGNPREVVVLGGTKTYHKFKSSAQEDFEAIHKLLVTKCGGVVVSRDEHNINYLRPGDSTQQRSAVLYGPEGSDNGEPLLQVFTSNWYIPDGEAIPEGSHSLRSLQAVVEGVINADTMPLTSVDDIDKLVKQKQQREEADKRFCIGLLKSRGVAYDPELTSKSLQKILDESEQVKLLDLISAQGDLSEQFRFKTAREILDAEVQEEHWLIEGLVGVGDTTKITAEAKTGKTTLVMCLAEALTSGQSLWGHKIVNSPLTVAMLDFEMKSHELKQNYLPNLNERSKDKLHLMLSREIRETIVESSDKSLDLFSTNVQDKLKRLLDEMGADVLVIDPIADAIYQSSVVKILKDDPMNNPALMAKFIDIVENIKPWGGAFIIHHTNAEGISRGARTLEDKPQSNWTLKKTGDNSSELKIVGRSAGRKTLNLMYNATTKKMTTDAVTTIKNKDIIDMGEKF